MGSEIVNGLLKATLSIAGASALSAGLVACGGGGSNSTLPDSVAIPSASPTVSASLSSNVETNIGGVKRKTKDDGGTGSVVFVINNNVPTLPLPSPRPGVLQLANANGNAITSDSLQIWENGIHTSGPVTAYNPNARAFTFEGNCKRR